jgi:hypothetical protein
VLRQSTQTVPQYVQLKQQILALAVDVLSHIIHLFRVASEIDFEAAFARVQRGYLL